MFNMTSGFLIDRLKNLDKDRKTDIIFVALDDDTDFVFTY
jgi:hypothetical protein